MSVTAFAVCTTVVLFTHFRIKKYDIMSACNYKPGTKAAEILINITACL